MPVILQPMWRGVLKRFEALRLAALIVAGAAFAVPSGARFGNDDLPEPEEGRWAETTFALLDYNRELCDDIAGKVVAYWRGLEAKPAAELEAVRRFIVDRELSNLAAGRAAADIVESFLPRVREEAGPETGAALERLHEMEVELCDTVAYPDASREEFESDLRKLLDRIEQEERELGRLLVVPEESLTSAIAPYLGRIQLAGVEAEGEYRDYLDGLKPPPQMPTLQELMEAWHLGYAKAVRPTKRALARYLEGRRTSDALLIRTACREISAAVIPLLRNDRVFKAPVGAVYEPLRGAFFELKLMAGECGAGRSREMETHYREMQQQLASASGLLAEYSLRP